MPYRIITGDLIQAARSGEVQVIAHQANCMNTMNSGVAKQIRAHFIDAWKADLATKAGDMTKLGGFSHVYIRHYLLHVYNLYGQYDYGYNGTQHTNYHALERSLNAMAEHVGKNFAGYLDPADVKIGLPKIGAGLGGGDWSIIEPLIIGALGEFDVTVFTLT